MNYVTLYDVSEVFILDGIWFPVFWGVGFSLIAYFAVKQNFVTESAKKISLYSALFISSLVILGSIISKLSNITLLKSEESRVISGVVKDYIIVKKDIGWVTFSVLNERKTVRFETNNISAYTVPRFPNISLINDVYTRITYEPKEKLILKVEISSNDYKSLQDEVVAKKKCMNDWDCYWENIANKPLKQDK